MHAILVSGHLHTTERQFSVHYVPAIDQAIAEGVRLFLVGGGAGTDAMAQRFLASKCNAFSDLHVAVYDKGSANNICAELPLAQVSHYGGFASYPDRDAAMTKASTDDIAFLVMDGKSLGSGTMQNLLRRTLATASAITNMLRQNGDLDNDVPRAVRLVEQNFGRADAAEFERLVKNHAMAMRGGDTPPDPLQ